ncbi:hypothetical protein FRC03_009293 [Tulasnella sp. 419]|nr:hypothetical protein FRC02_007447 [Tulasnella sp. 418]KAG8958260.1 hypothetical protein FRC03_009293 [Tulasnella sp. 419]
MNPILAIAFLFYSLIGLTNAVTHEVIVGGPGKLVYSPESLTATVGDSIRFVFQQKNHTATQSSLQKPCEPVAGFDSGFMAVADDVTSNYPTFDIFVKDTNPIWVYCRQGNHCSQGMVFAVNAGDKFQSFKQNALTGGAPATTSQAAYGTATSAAAAATSSKSGAISLKSASVLHIVLASVFALSLIA